eukprot:11274487-Alexandrium_andersonii.AAC.1
MSASLVGSEMCIRDSPPCPSPPPWPTQRKPRGMSGACPKLAQQRHCKPARRRGQTLALARPRAQIWIVTSLTIRVEALSLIHISEPTRLALI